MAPKESRATGTTRPEYKEIVIAKLIDIAGFSRDLWSGRTPKEALRDLLRLERLRFGDDNQVEALFILRLAEQLIATERPCHDCNGTGEVKSGEGFCDCCGRRCDHCEGALEDCTNCDGGGITHWTRYEVYRMRPMRICEELGRVKEAAEAA